MYRKKEHVNLPKNKSELSNKKLNKHKYKPKCSKNKSNKIKNFNKEEN